MPTVERQGRLAHDRFMAKSGFTAARIAEAAFAKTGPTVLEKLNGAKVGGAEAHNVRDGQINAEGDLIFTFDVELPPEELQDVDPD